MKAIYEPRGRAKEYADLSVNLYKGCRHSCSYCYGPASLHRDVEQFHRNAGPRDGILDKLEADCKKMKGDARTVLLCFFCDPYQPMPKDEDVTRKALQILEAYDMRVTVLTKGGMRAERDFDILARNRWGFGTTLVFNEDRTDWEPGAAPISDRKRAIASAKARGIPTWISVEPVIDPASALEMIREMLPYVDHWKLGKINHAKEIEASVDWTAFLKSAEKALEGASYYVKKDLERYRG